MSQTCTTLLVEVAEDLWLVKSGDTWRLSQPWATCWNWRTSRKEHCTEFANVEVRVLRAGEWLRIIVSDG